MTAAMLKYVAVVDRMNRWIGRIVMYGIFVMMAILLWSSFTKLGSDIGLDINPSLWTLEMAQFAMVAYYILGGPYSIQMGSNVRMDLLYGEWSDRRKAQVDAFTVLFLIVYLGFLLWGGWDSLMYSFQYGGERSNSVWRPYLWPIKLIMVVGIFLMLLQAVSEFFKDILRLKGHDMGPKDEDSSDARPDGTRT
ncbi:Tripartite ATP-independent periplasmic transporter, DctQ component [Roseovarius sp. THAF27]|uniref:TRAP transporter small permease subunit n=1 Tax=unclassified Roseovarius TaxID=2614913 RepID=UPI001268F81A|nr:MULTISPECIES: TRAP transporter small permease subunit [unclassified Roseovarius]QFT81239.1 Tripartite ATP-independent periplasmic transporter, DctQ component [Roseovarius sp. THAF27]QFT99626.1 Tripartite ATP-independent periplasmic transporter, DctQ component [Roseovarius sp. THAF8]